MSPFNNIAQSIIKEQELVIGPLAWSEARKVSGLHIDVQGNDVTLEGGDPKATIDRLVSQYERLFGRASQEVCKEAAAGITATMSRADIPASLLT